MPGLPTGVSPVRQAAGRKGFAMLGWPGRPRERPGETQCQNQHRRRRGFLRRAVCRAHDNPMESTAWRLAGMSKDGAIEQRFRQARKARLRPGFFWYIAVTTRRKPLTCKQGLSRPPGWPPCFACCRRSPAMPVMPTGVAFRRVRAESTLRTKWTSLTWSWFPSMVSAGITRISTPRPHWTG